MAKKRKRNLFPARDKKPALKMWFQERHKELIHKLTIELIKDGFQYSDIQIAVELVDDLSWDIFQKILDKISGINGEINYMSFVNKYYEKVGKPKVKKRKPKPRKYDMYIWEED